MKYIVLVYQFAFPIHEAFLYELKESFGISAEYITTDEFLQKDFVSGTVFIFLVSYTVQKDNPEYLQKIRELKEDNSTIIFYNDIELNMPDVYHKHIIKKDMYKLYDQIWSYDDSHRGLIEKLNVPFYYIPYGYSKYYESYTIEPPTEYKYDFVFFGRTSKYGGYRKTQLDIMRKAGLKIKILTDVYHDELIQELLNAKIVLNIKSGENIIDLDFPRYSLLVGLNKFFITDTYNDKSGVEDKLKSMFVFAKDRKDMIRLAKEYLSKPDSELNEITKKGYKQYKDNYSGFLNPLNDTNILL